jgi:hypothetical protein
LGDKRKALGTIIDKLGKLLAHLGNENDGEALGAARAITALLRKAGLDWHDLVALLHGNQPSVLDMLAGLMENEADALVRLGRAGATLFCSSKNVAYADVKVGAHVVTLALTSREFQEWLGLQYFGEKNKAPKLASERDAMRTLGAYARYQGGPRCEVRLRSGRVGERR